MPRRYTLLAVLSCLLFGIAGALSTLDTLVADQSASDGRRWSINSGKTIAVRDAAGSLDVDESVAVEFTGGAFRGFYRDIPLGKNQTSKVIAVSDSALGEYQPGGSAELGSSGRPGLYGSVVLPQGLRIVWHHNSTGRKTFSSVYSITPVGDRYSDADYLKVNLWGDAWPSFVPKVSGVLRLDRALPAGTQIGTSPSWIGAKTSVSGKAVTLTASNVPARQGVAVALRLPRGALAGAVVTHSGNAPAARDSSPLDGMKRSTTNSMFTRFAFWAVMLLVFGQIPVWAWFVWHRRRLADATWDGGSEFEYRPPSGQTLVAGYVAAEETAPPPARAYVATLMDLVARGFYARENVRDEKSGEWRLQIAPCGLRDEDAQLSAGEAAVVSFTDLLLAEGPCVADDLDGRVNPTTHRVPFTEMKTALLADGDGISDSQKSSSWWVKAAAVAWLLAVACGTFALTAPSSTLSSTGKLFVLGPLFVLSAAQVRAWPRGDFVYTSAELAAVQGQWRQWRDWILHFDQMNDAPDLGVILWERAFAGALMWGVAEQFVARVKVLVPELNEGTLAMGNSAFYGAGIGSSISSAAAPPASAFGGGGGFDGGGGGGGGGGAW